MNVTFDCTPEDAVRIQKCLWHGFFDLCDGGLSGEYTIESWQKSLYKLDDAIRNQLPSPRRKDSSKTIKEKKVCKKDHRRR